MSLFIPISLMAFQIPSSMIFFLCAFSFSILKVGSLPRDIERFSFIKQKAAVRKNLKLWYFYMIWNCYLGKKPRLKKLNHLVVSTKKSETEEPHGGKLNSGWRKLFIANLFLSARFFFFLETDRELKGERGQF